jgi:hypothetical protein
MKEWQYSSAVLALGTRWKGGQLDSLAALPSREIALGIYCIGGWVGLRTGLDPVEYRKISCSCRESKPRPSSP